MIQSRLSLCVTGQEILAELKKDRKLENLRSILSEVSFEKSPEKSAQRKGSDTLQYFVSRRQIMKAAMAVLTDFEECQALKSFWKGAERDALGYLQRHNEGRSVYRLARCAGVIAAGGDRRSWASNDKQDTERGNPGHRQGATLRRVTRAAVTQSWWQRLAPKAERGPGDR